MRSSSKQVRSEHFGEGGRHVHVAPGKRPRTPSPLHRGSGHAAGGHQDAEHEHEQHSIAARQAARELAAGPDDDSGDGRASSGPLDIPLFDPTWMEADHAGDAAAAEDDALAEDHEDEVEEEASPHASPRTAAPTAHTAAPTAHAAQASPHAQASAHRHKKTKKKKKHLPDPYARTDKYNRLVRRGHHGAPRPDQLNRPGVRFHGKDLYHVPPGTPRYIVGDGPTHARPFDTVVPNETEKGHVESVVALNPAHPRKLLLPGHKHAVMCVMSWTRFGGSAWIELSKIHTRKHAALLRTIKKTMRRWGPKRPPRKAIKHAAHRVFREFDPTHPQLAALENRFIKGHQHHGPDGTGGPNLVNHYLYRAAGGGYYNVAMNLPQHAAPPVATDTARPGDSFYIAHGHPFRRLAGTFNGDGPHDHPTHRNQYMEWVFGFLGRNGKPDPTRAGWVPLAVLRTP